MTVSLQPKTSAQSTSRTKQTHAVDEGTAKKPASLRSLGFTVDVNPKLGGAYFRKIASAPNAQARGIVAKGTLPTPTFDPKRFFVSPEGGLDDFKTGPLDRPSVYLGGHAGNKETDVGLTWDRVYDSHGSATYTDRSNGSDGDDPAHRFTRGSKDGQPALLDGNGKVVAQGAEMTRKLAALQPNFAFRPYWRTTNGNGNQWTQPPKGSPHNQYFYPGQKIAMTFKDVGKGQVRLDIQLDGATTPRHFVQDFPQEGFGVGKAESFKRVNSIDQFTVDATGHRKGVEGGHVLPTHTQVVGAHWDSVGLLVKSRTQPMVGPSFVDTRAGELAPQYGNIFKTSGFNDRGGERIDITPGG